MSVRSIIALVVTFVALAVSGSAGATFAGNNGQLAFSKDGVIYLAGTNGADPVPVLPRGLDGTVLDPKTLKALAPAWSPDGSRIAFTGRRHENGVSNADVYVMNADGSGLERLTYAPSFDFMPVWSPDGSMIAFTSNRKLKDRFDLYLMQATGVNVRPLVEANTGDPVWSPDGSVISFREVPTNFRFTVALDGSPPKLVPLLWGARDLDWSPDGSRIAFRQDVPDQGYHIFTARPDGTNVRQITRTTPRPPTKDRPSGPGELAPRTLAEAPSLAENTDPTWSPDGRSIAVSIDPVSGPAGIHLMNADGSNLHQIVTPQLAGEVLSWQSLPPDTPDTPDQPSDTPNTTGDSQPTPQPRNANGCTITGTSGDDVLVGTPGRDVICALGGDDLIKGLGGNDVIRAGAGDDIVKAGPGRDRVFGQAGDDELHGQNGKDTLKAGAGDDELYGNRGPDRLYGQAGHDTLHAKQGGKDLLKGGKGEDEATADRSDRLRSIEHRF